MKQEKQTPGERLREARLELNMKQSDLSKYIGYTAESISRIENNRLDFNPAIMEALFKIGINGYAVMYGKKQLNEYQNTIIFSTDGNRPVFLQGYLISGDFSEKLIEKSPIMRDVQSRFIWAGENFKDEIRSGDVLYIDHHSPFEAGDLIVEYGEDMDEPLIYEVEELRDNSDELLFTGLNDKFTSKKKEIKSHPAFTGKIRYITREIRRKEK